MNGEDKKLNVNNTAADKQVWHKPELRKFDVRNDTNAGGAFITDGGGRLMDS